MWYTTKKNTSAVLPQIHLTDIIITRIYRATNIKTGKSSRIQSTTRKRRELVNVQYSQLQDCNRKRN